MNVSINVLEYYTAILFYGRSNVKIKSYTLSVTTHLQYLGFQNLFVVGIFMPMY